MGWKCAPQVMGLVRGEPMPGQKHRANLRKIAMEAGYERASRSDTLDRRRSYLNRYEGYKSGAIFSNDMEQEAAEYRVQVKGKTKDGQAITREKGLPHNAVVAWAVIYNPPAEVCATWSDEQYAKFHRDCRACMAEIEPRLFRQENIRMSAEHFDEGVPVEHGSVIDRHFHDLGISKDIDGHYCGNLVDARLMTRINEKFPALMRKRGWDVDNLDCTDFERAKEDKEYAAERSAMRGKYGLSVNRHLSQKAREMVEDAAEMADQAAMMLGQAAEQKQQMESDIADKQQKLEAAAQELKEIQKQLKRQDKSQRRFASFIHDTIEELGGAHTKKFATYADARAALTAAKNHYMAEAKQKAREEVAAEFQERETVLAAQEAILTELTGLRNKIDQDTSRKRFMEAHTVKNGRTLEEIYQKSVRDFQERREAFLHRGEELAAEYYSLHEAAGQLEM